MEHNVEHIRALVERWLTAETTLAEEQTLRDFFDGVHPEMLPADLRPYPHLFGQSVQAAGERSRRKLVLHTDPPTAETFRQSGVSGSASRVSGASSAAETSQAMERSQRRTTFHRPIVRRLAAMTAAAAAIAAAAVVFIAPEQTHSGDILCVVDGVRITDPEKIALYTREALEVTNQNLQKPGHILSSKLSSDPALERVGAMLNELTQTQ